MKKMVMTFDDALMSHFTVAYPELKKYGFSATFFVTAATGLWRAIPDQYEDHLNWAQIKILNDEGFEIGNHTMYHYNPTAIAPSLIEKDIVDLDQKLIELGIPKPVSYAYPGYHYNDTVQEVLKRTGFQYARIGYIVKCKANERKQIFYYTKEHKNNLLINCTGIFCDCIYDHSYFLKDIENTPPNGIPIISCHGLRKEFTRNAFIQSMKYLHDNGWQVIPMRDLQRTICEFEGKSIMPTEKIPL